MLAKKRIKSLYIDGTLYSDDQLARDSHERVRSLPYLAATTDGLNSGTAFGFTNQKVFEDWISRNDLSAAYDRINEAMRTLSDVPDQADQQAREQTARVDEDTRWFSDVLRKNNVTSDDPDGVLRLAQTKKLGNSYTLYRYPDFQGKVIYFQSYIPYPNYKWFDFNNMASSAIHWGAATLLCQTTWYRDRKILLAGTILVSHLGDWPYYFNNLTSSSCGA